MGTGYERASPSTRFLRLPSVARASAKALLHIAVLFVLGCVVREVASLDKLLGNASQVVASKLVTPHYLARRAQVWPPGQQQGMPLIVLLRDADLSSLKLTYPPPYELHAGLLDVFSQGGAQAAFIDFSFKDSRSNRSSLADLTAQIDALAEREPPFPMYLAMYKPHAPTTPDCWGVVPELARRFQGVETSVCALKPPPSVKSGLIPVNVSLERPEDDGATTYSARGADAQDSSAAAPWSPAYALARGAQAASTASTMEIVWVAQVSDDEKGKDECAPLGLLALLRDGLEAAEQSCPFIDVVSAAALLDMPDETRRRLLEGRVVFYGGDVELSSDRHPVALHGQVPGVFVHAMAYDNLMTYGADGVKSQGWLARALRAMTHPREPRPYDLMLLMCAVVVVALPYLVRQMQSIAPRRPGTWATSAARRRWQLLPVGVPVLAIWLLLSPTAMTGVLTGAVLYVLLRATFDASFYRLMAFGLVLLPFAYLVLDIGPLYLITWVAMFELVQLVQHRLNDWHLHLRQLQRALSATTPRAQRVVVSATQALLSTFSSKGKPS